MLTTNTQKGLQMKNLFMERLEFLCKEHERTDEIQGIGVRLKTCLGLLDNYYNIHNDNQQYIILDLAGTYSTSMFLSKAFGKNSKVICQSWPNQELAKFIEDNCKGQNIEVRMGDSIVLKEINDSEVDIVFAGEIIEHIYDIELMMENIRRVLKPNGVFLGTTPNLASWSSRITLLLGKCPHIYDPYPTRYEGLFGVERTKRAIPKILHDYHIRVGTPDLLVSFLEKSGFTNVSYDTTNIYGKERKLSSIRRMLNIILPKNMKENISFCGFLSGKKLK